MATTAIVKFMSSAIPQVSVAIGAPPRDGAANTELVEFMARLLSVKKRDVSLVVGHKSHEKVVAVTGLSRQDVEERMRSACTD